MHRSMKKRNFNGQDGPWTCAWLCILKSHGSAACLDARAANVTANVQLRARAAVVGAACGTLLREAERGKDIQITAGADHCDVTMPRTHHGIFIEGFKKKK